MRTILLNPNASISGFSLPVNLSFLQVHKSQVIVYLMPNFKKNACLQNITVFFLKRINTCHLLTALVGSMVVAKGTSQFIVKGHRA